MNALEISHLGRVAGLDRHLFDAVRDWLAEVWPFRNVAFPGRTIDWADFKAAIE